jgi:hypothetical protein
MRRSTPRLFWAVDRRRPSPRPGGSSMFDNSWRSVTPYVALVAGFRRSAVRRTAVVQADVLAAIPKRRGRVRSQVAARDLPTRERDDETTNLHTCESYDEAAGGARQLVIALRVRREGVCEEIPCLSIFTLPSIAGVDLLLGFGREPNLHSRASSRCARVPPRTARSRLRLGLTGADSMGDHGRRRSHGP